jgi:hypothetical protein
MEPRFGVPRSMVLALLAAALVSSTAFSLRVSLGRMVAPRRFPSGLALASLRGRLCLLGGKTSGTLCSLGRPTQPTCFPAHPPPHTEQTFPSDRTLQVTTDCSLNGGDTDGDGVCDDVDICPSVPNGDQVGFFVFCFCHAEFLISKLQSRWLAWVRHPPPPFISPQNIPLHVLLCGTHFCGHGDSGTPRVATWRGVRAVRHLALAAQNTHTCCNDLCAPAPSLVFPWFFWKRPLCARLCNNYPASTAPQRSSPSAACPVPLFLRPIKTGTALGTSVTTASPSQGTKRTR